MLKKSQEKWDSVRFLGGVPGDIIGRIPRGFLGEIPGEIPERIIDGIPEE